MLTCTEHARIVGIPDPGGNEWTAHSIIISLHFMTLNKSGCKQNLGLGPWASPWATCGPPHGPPEKN